MTLEEAATNKDVGFATTASFRQREGPKHEAKECKPNARTEGRTARIRLEATAGLPRLDAGANWWVRNPDAGRWRTTPQQRAQREEEALPGAEGALERRASPSLVTGPALTAMTFEPWLPLGVEHEGKPHEHVESIRLPGSRNQLFRSRKMEGEFSISPDPTCSH